MPCVNSLQIQPSAVEQQQLELSASLGGLARSSHPTTDGYIRRLLCESLLNIIEYLASSETQGQIVGRAANGVGGKR